jgi:hypothetical protein
MSQNVRQHFFLFKALAQYHDFRKLTGYASGCGICRAFFLEKEVLELTRGERTNIRKAL